MSAHGFTPSTESTDEVADDLVARLMAAIHEHAEDNHAGRGGPEINGPLVVAALARTLAELLLNVPPGRVRDDLVAFHASAFHGVLRSAATGEAVDLTFTAAGAAH